MLTTVKSIKPLSDYVLIEPLEKETTTASGIVIPDTIKEKPQEGKVVAVGPGKLGDDSDNQFRYPMTVKPGDIVMYKKWGGTEIKVKDGEYLLVREEDILAIIS